MMVMVMVMAMVMMVALIVKATTITHIIFSPYRPLVGARNMHAQKSVAEASFRSGWCRMHVCAYDDGRILGKLYKQNLYNKTHMKRNIEEPKCM